MGLVEITPAQYVVTSIRATVNNHVRAKSKSLNVNFSTMYGVEFSRKSIESFGLVLRGASISDGEVVIFLVRL